MYSVEGKTLIAKERLLKDLSKILALTAACSKWLWNQFSIDDSLAKAFEKVTALLHRNP